MSTSGQRGRSGQGKPAPTPAAGATVGNGLPTVEGRIIASFGRHYSVELAGGEVLQCYPRGKKGTAAVGDRVAISRQGTAEGAIEAISPRTNLLYRSDEQRSKQFAANVDQLMIVVATEPEFSDDLAGRALIAGWSAGIAPVLVLNKIDRVENLARARARLAPLSTLGAPVIELSARDEASVRAQLLPLMAGRTTLLLGQSGMGKSTLLNVLVPEAHAATREHSTALGAGRHTTTSTRLYHLPDGGDLIDSPGFQGFGLHHLSREEVERGFPEFAPFAAQCRFYNCTHRHEPGCGVLEGMAQGKIDAARHALYVRVIDANEDGQRY